MGSRRYAGAADQLRMAQLARAFPDGNLHVVDLPYRLSWRARTLQQPEYVPELDVVVQAPDGRLVAFCIGWAGTSGNNTIGQIEPLGVHPEYRQLGLGRAVLFEGVRRLQQRGAGSIIVETDDDRDAAVALYQAAGFEVAHKILIYRYDVEDTA